jgi:hypothetical protein
VAQKGSVLSRMRHATAPIWRIEIR